MEIHHPHSSEDDHRGYLSSERNMIIPRAQVLDVLQRINVRLIEFIYEIG